MSAHNTGIMVVTRADMFTALFTGGPGVLELRALPSKARVFVAPGDGAAIGRFAQAHAGENLYFGVASRRNATNGTLENCQTLSALFADIDFKTTPEPEARDRLARFPWRPSCIIGSGGGLHPYFLLRDPLALPGEADRAKNLLRRLAVALGGDLAAAEPARVLRLPGSVNHKYDPPRPVTLELLEPTRRYTLSDVDEILPSEPEPERGAPFQMPGSVEQGARNGTLYGLGRALHAKGLSEPAIVAALLEENRARCRPPLPEVEVRDLAHHAAEQPDRPDFAAAPPDEAAHLTDQGNAQRFARQHGGSVHYVHPQHRWLCWLGTHWAPDAEGGAVARAKQTGRSVYEEAARAEDPDRRKALARWAAYSESEPACRRMLALAQSEPGIPLLPDALDREPYVLNALNGIVNLRDGQLGPHDPARLLTKLAPVAYDPAAPCPRFLAFLDRIFAGRQALIDFIGRAMGYALAGDPCEQVVLLWHGDGSNGKSTLLKVLHAILGDYAVASPAETFLVKRDGAIPCDVARLHKSRLVTATELEGGKRLAEAFIKGATGGDLLTARFLHAEWFSFAPTFVPILVFNRKPRITGRDRALWRRVLLVPFGVTIPEAEQDRHLAERLITDEGPGILTWLVQGGLAWQRDGLRVPDEVRTATREYRHEEDVLAPFLVETCILEAEARIGVGELYGAYARWADEGRDRGGLNRTEFRAALLTHEGIGAERTKAARTWTGIRLRTQTDPDPADEPEPIREGVAPW